MDQKYTPDVVYFIADCVINTIQLQHNTKAHPRKKTQQVNKDYQLNCLLAKSDGSIAQFLVL
jgi:hypothetical protein